MDERDATFRRPVRLAGQFHDNTTSAQCGRAAETDGVVTKPLQRSESPDRITPAPRICALPSIRLNGSGREQNRRRDRTAQDEMAVIQRRSPQPSASIPCGYRPLS